jgi:hypothetical protein
MLSCAFYRIYWLLHMEPRSPRLPDPSYISTAFNTFKYDILTALQRLRQSFGFSDRSLARSLARTDDAISVGTYRMRVRHGDSYSQPRSSTVNSGVSQSSLLFCPCILLHPACTLHADLSSIIPRHGLSSHLYADDTIRHSFVAIVPTDRPTDRPTVQH